MKRSRVPEDPFGGRYLPADDPPPRESQMEPLRRYVPPEPDMVYRATHVDDPWVALRELEASRASYSLDRYPIFMIPGWFSHEPTNVRHSLNAWREMLAMSAATSDPTNPDKQEMARLRKRMREDARVLDPRRFAIIRGDYEVVTPEFTDTYEVSHRDITFKGREERK